MGNCGSSDEEGARVRVERIRYEETRRHTGTPGRAGTTGRAPQDEERGRGSTSVRRGGRQPLESSGDESGSESFD